MSPVVNTVPAAVPTPVGKSVSNRAAVASSSLQVQPEMSPAPTSTASSATAVTVGEALATGVTVAGAVGTAVTVAGPLGTGATSGALQAMRDVSAMAAAIATIAIGETVKLLLGP